MNTQPLDNALEYKRRVDVPYFTPDYFFGSGKSKGDALQKGDSIQWMKNALLIAPQPMNDEEHRENQLNLKISPKGAERSPKLSSHFLRAFRAF